MAVRSAPKHQSSLLLVALMDARQELAEITGHDGAVILEGILGVLQGLSLLTGILALFLLKMGNCDLKYSM